MTMKHGTKWTYIQHKCRCEPCTAANTQSKRGYRAKLPKRTRNVPRDTKRVAIMYYKATNPCLDCGVMYPAVCMDFDHRDPTTKRFLISHGLHNSCATVMTELLKCDLVCSNCHRLRTHNLPKLNSIAYT